MRPSVHAEFGTRLKKMREDAGLKQRRVAEALGVAASSVCLWESGVSLPKIDRRLGLAQLYSVDVKCLIPEAYGLQQRMVSDPQMLLLVEQFEKLSPSLRQAFLTQILAVTEAMKGMPPE